MSIEFQPGTKPSATNSATGSRLGPKVRLQGDLKVDEALAVRGKFEGSINNPKQSIVVADSADISADITASRIKVEGRVRGNILGVDRIELTSTADVVGKLQTREVKVEEGAVFRGEVNVIADQNPTSE